MKFERKLIDKNCDGFNHGFGANKKEPSCVDTKKEGSLSVLYPNNCRLKKSRY